MADRTPGEAQPKSKEFVSCDDDDLYSDLDDETTLTQLRKMLLTKKRKYSCSIENSKLDNAYVQSVEYESDLIEPLINWKSKRSKKSRVKKKCMNASVVSKSTTGLGIKSDRDLVSRGSMQFAGELAAVVCVKVEVQEYDQLERHNEIIPAHDLLIGHNEGLTPDDVASNECQDMFLCEYREPLPCANEYQNVIDEILGDDLEDVEPIAMLVPWNETILMLEPLESGYEVLPGKSPLAIENAKEMEEAHSCGGSPSQDPNGDMSGHSRGPYCTKERSQRSNCSGIQILNRGEGLRQDLCEDKLMKAEKQTSTSPSTGEECDSNRTYENVDTLSTLEPFRPTKRLLLTRQAMSPSSQERLQLHSAMISAELYKDADQYKYNEKLFEKQTKPKVSPVRSGTQQAKITVNDGQPGQFSQEKVIRDPRHIIKKSKIATDNLEGPRFSRTLPNLITSCTSINGCSESAIAFSQRQMHDMESLAVRLLNELNSMKDIVQQKLLFPAYRNISLKNDADEVKSAIKSATKIEQMAQKWMSVMTRDCNRFCKIMKMTPNSGDAPATVPREKKILFADEAGKKLCHVKLFGDGNSSAICDDVNQQEP